MDNIISKPWGYYTVLYQSENTLTKHLVVNPGGRLSLQKHEYRVEHWKVESGEGEAAVAGETIPIKKGDVIFIPAHAFHRIKNTSEEKLLVIYEIQTGEYLSEDDIVIVEDDYGRV
jgi:mannose-6-phosphate isomerase-like protein (cupin superfamily)